MKWLVLLLIGMGITGCVNGGYPVNGKMRNPGRDISFPLFISKEIETRKLERKSTFTRYNKSLKRYKMEWKLKQENRMEIKSRKTEKKLKQ